MNIPVALYDYLMNALSSLAPFLGIWGLTALFARSNKAISIERGKWYNLLGDGDLLPWAMPIFVIGIAQLNRSTHKLDGSIFWLGGLLLFMNGLAFGWLNFLRIQYDKQNIRIDVGDKKNIAVVAISFSISALLFGLLAAVLVN